MGTDRFLGDLENADAADVGGRAGEVLVDQRTRQADGLEYLRTGVRHIGGDAHFRHHLAQTLAHGFDEILDSFVAVDTVDLAAVGNVEYGLQRQVGMHGFRAVTAEHCKVMHFARGTGFDDEAGAGAQALVDQVMMNGRQREQCRDRDMIAVNMTVGNDDDRITRTHGVFGLCGQAGQTRLDGFLAPCFGVGNVQFTGLELAVGVTLDVADFFHLVEIQHRLADFEADRRIGFIDAQQIGLRSDERYQRGDQFLANRINRRVGDLREQLFEILIQILVLGREHRQWRIVAHGADWFFTVTGHRCEDELEVFLGVTEGLLTIQQRHGAALRLCLLAVDIIQFDADAFNPFDVRFG